MALPFEIKTDRLLLRPYRQTDVDDVFAFAADPEWSRFLPVPQPYLYQHAVEFVEMHLDTSNKWDLNPRWAIEQGGKCVGGINIRLHSHDQLAEMGYSLARTHWGQGYMTEAATAVTNSAFSHIPPLNRIRAMADKRNHGSLRIMHKLGMQQEGVLRQNRKTHGELIDEVWCGILRPEWEARQTN